MGKLGLNMVNQNIVNHNPAQFGLIKRRSFVLQLLAGTLGTIYKSLEEGEQVNMVNTVYEKAFHHVDDGLLLR